MSKAVVQEIENSGKILPTLIGCAFLSFSILIFLPIEIFTSNLNEFSMRLVDLVKILIPAWALSTVCAFTAVLFVPVKFRFRVLSLIFVFGLLFWIQGSILVWEYGPLDGADIDWSKQGVNGLVDSAIWIAAISVAIWAPFKLIKICYPLAILAMLVQSAFVLLTSDIRETEVGDSSKRKFTIVYDKKYEFSENQNVILIVLDAFQSDVFEEIVNSEPEYANLFSGFTYFRDAVAGGNYTELAIPALLTGQTYDNSVEREKFLQDAFVNYGLTTQLKKEGYYVEMYPWVGWGNESIYFDENVASNLKRNDPQAEPDATYTEKNAKEALHILDLALFRSVPHYFKTFIHNDHKWFLGYLVSHMVPDGIKQIISTENQFEAGTFVNQGPTVFATNRQVRVFKYFHFKGAHSPLTVNEKLEFTSQVFAFSRQNYINQAKANLLALGQFFEKLRAAGIYKDSIIAIVGDHGSGDSPGLYIEPPGASRKPYRLEGTKRNFRRDKARAIPLVLVKGAGQSSPLEISNAPVALTDLPATITAELGLVSASGGHSMFELDATESRTRFHGAFEFSPNKQSYVDDITLYRIEGNSWSNESWTVDTILEGGTAADNE